jgi:hypothetical protein
VSSPRLPPLLSIAEAVAVVESHGLALTHGQVKRLLRSNASRWPKLVVFAGRKWLVRKDQLAELLGLPDEIGLEPRVFELEARVIKLERARR